MLRNRIGPIRATVILENGMERETIRGHLESQDVDQFIYHKPFDMCKDPTNYGSLMEHRYKMNFTLLIDDQISEMIPAKPKQMKKENDMFENYKVTSLEIGDLTDEALEFALEDLENSNSDFQIRKKGDKTFLWKDGKVLPIKGKEFISMVETAIVGKTLKEIKTKGMLFTLIEKMSLFDKITLEKPESDFESILG